MSANSKVKRPAPGEPLRIVVVAEDPLVRDTLAATLGQQSAGSPGEGAVRVVEDAKDAHVALLDPGAVRAKSARPLLEAGLAPIAQLDIPSVVLAESEPQARAALARGARGAVMRKADGPRLVAALAAVSTGLTVVDFSLSAPPPPEGEDAPPLSLTTREHEVLELLAAGYSNRRIARRLQISEHTAKFHVNGILVKLGAGTRTEAVVIAARRGLVML